jgi:FkbM family methyltransferase
MRAPIRSALDGVSDLVRFAQRSVRWPVFSVTSNRLVSGLVDQGVVPTSVVDVGANRGQFAIAILELVPTASVISFEPLPAQAAQLAKLTRHYAPRFEVRNLALGSRPARLELHVNKHHQSSSLRALSRRHLNAFPDARETESIFVDVDRLDCQLSTADLRPGAMLKIDVQGFERDVIDGASGVLQRFDTLLIEASFQALYEGEWTFLEMVEDLKSKGFNFVRPVGFLQDPVNAEFLQMDALFRRVGVPVPPLV